MSENAEPNAAIMLAAHSEPSATNMAERYGTAGHALAAASASDAASHYYCRQAM